MKKAIVAITLAFSLTALVDIHSAHPAAAESDALAPAGAQSGATAQQATVGSEEDILSVDLPNVVSAPTAPKTLPRSKTSDAADLLEPAGGPRVLVSSTVYAFRAEAAKGEPFLKDLLPLSLSGFNAVARLGAFEQNEMEQLSEKLAGQGQVKVLARPQFTTVSGRPASLQMGSEVPIVVPQQGEKVAVEYRRVGPRLDVVPVLLGNGTCRLEMRCEMTEIDGDRSVAIGGLSNPAFRTRVVDTAMELKPNQAMVIALLEVEGEAAYRESNELRCTVFVATPSPMGSVAGDTSVEEVGPSPAKANNVKPPLRNAKRHRDIR